MKQIDIHGVKFYARRIHGNAVSCKVGHPDCNQHTFIPLIYFNEDLSLKPNADLRWFLKKKDTQRKFEYFKIWERGFELRNRLNTLDLGRFPARFLVDSDVEKMTKQLKGSLEKDFGKAYSDSLITLPYVYCWLNEHVNPLVENVEKTIARADSLLGTILTRSQITYYVDNRDRIDAVIFPMEEWDRIMWQYDQTYMYEHEVVRRTIDYINERCVITEQINEHIC